MTVFDDALAAWRSKYSADFDNYMTGVSSFSTSEKDAIREATKAALVGTSGSVGGVAAGPLSGGPLTVGRPLSGILALSFKEVVFSGSSYSGEASMNWSVEEADQFALTFSYLSPRLMYVNFDIRNSCISGTAAGALRIKIPDARNACDQSHNMVYINTGGNHAVGTARSIPGDPWIWIEKLDDSNWSLSSNHNIQVRGQIIVPVE